MRILAAGLALVMMAGAFAFVLRFKDNLHCTQYTSFRIAAFEMQPHVEEAIEGGPPLVYRPPFAIPLRIYLGLSLLTFLFIPPTVGLLVTARVVRYHVWRRLLAIASAVLLVNAVTPNIIVGERFSALAWYALLASVVPALVMLILLRNVRAQVTAG